MFVGNAIWEISGKLYVNGRLMKISRMREIIKAGGMKGLSIAVLEKLLIKLKKKSGSNNISDTFTDHLEFANAGSLQKGNLYCIDMAIRHLPEDSSIVEIGSFCGLSTNIITYYKQKHSVGNAFYNCDPWKYEKYEGAEKGNRIGHSSITYEEYSDFVKESFKRNVKTFSRNNMPSAIEMYSDEFFGAWGKSQDCIDIFGKKVKLGGPIGFCFIDGNHSYDFVRRDFENTDRFLAKGGFILFDDSSDGSGWDVCKVIKEVCREKNYELIMKNPNYFFKKK
jgi:hypothetical protein